jgi:hypothetical protein
LRDRGDNGVERSMGSRCQLVDGVYGSMGQMSDGVGRSAGRVMVGGWVGVGWVGVGLC